MKIQKNDLVLYVVTDRTWLGKNSLIQQIEQTLKAGATMLQLREKNISDEEFINEAIQVKKITEHYHIPLIINDRIEVAIASNADGVHLGQEDDGIRNARALLGQDKIIGISAHTVEEAITAQENGADYIGVGAVFGTYTKKDAKPIPYKELKEICSSVTIPVVAIGGITRDNIGILSGSGVDGVAVISAIFTRNDIAEATNEMLKLSKMIINKDNMPV